MAGQKGSNSGGWGTSPAAGQQPASGWAGPQPTQDINVLDFIPLKSPHAVIHDLPMTPAVNRTVVESRETVRRILSGLDGRMLIVVGPCSNHDPKAAMEYAGRLRELATELQGRIYVIMRVYFEKPRTTVGWKGLINDPRMDDSFDMDQGLHLARRVLLDITSLGLPAGAEMLEPITPQYIADLVTWSSIGARTIESQTHRQMASGLSMPVGYKNGTEGSLQNALDAMKSARSPHHFVGIDDQGRTAIVRTRGNPWSHLILRGGRNGPNNQPEKGAEAAAALRKAGLPCCIMVDCSHANSEKKYQNQARVLRNVIEQRLAGNSALMGLLIESHLFPGNQPCQSDRSKLAYGVSVTDECMGWDETAELLRWAADQLTNERR